ncbi:MAG: tRNA (5-methylaminomethyl-2-thiouridine)(34)-methyltransferase MnmD [Flavobacteriales bacterium]|nr:tRNA (5-methylaminomethyl-2-thiouridine)(34)-methyltransferase MnmD [Flavobacteriales bacterium]
MSHNPEPETRIERTADGSLTVLDVVTGSTYHSRHGARTESIHVFIRAGLDFLREKGLQHFQVLEMGFGTGLNAFLTAERTLDGDISVDYTALEAFPLAMGMWEEVVNQELHCTELFRTIHASPWGERAVIAERFSIVKHHIRLQDFFSQEKFDLIYYDAFEPNTQPELWTEEVFRKLFDMSAPGGVVVTYCAKGSVRRAMQAAGYTVERLPGPPFKREMLRAVRR